MRKLQPLWVREAPVGIEPTNGGFAVLRGSLQTFRTFPKLLHSLAYISGALLGFSAASGDAGHEDSRRMNSSVALVLSPSYQV